jgi:outer membrane protein assembly factor BamB
LIARALDSGTLGENEYAYTGYLMDVLRNNLNRSFRLYPQVQIRHRVQALRLLGRIGSPELIPFLADVFSRDGEPLVKAAAAEALGSIGIDPGGITMRAFTNAIFPPGALRDEQALLGVAAAAAALCRFTGPPLADTGIKILTSLTAPDRPPAVQRQALQELRSFRN